MSRIELLQAGNTQDKIRVIGLDLVRVVAISLVLTSHIVVRRFEFLGIYGVELFFALSGFLIGGILYRRLAVCVRWSFSEVKTFWVRRWWRTLPNYYLFLVISAVLQLFLGDVPAGSEWLPFLVFSQDFFSRPSGFYLVSWSLCVEEWFYLIFPLCIYVMIKLKCTKRRAFLTTTFLFLALPPMLREYAFTSYVPDVVRMMTMPRLDAIFYGVAMAFIFARHRFSSVLKLALLVIGAFGVVSVYLLQSYCIRDNSTIIFYRVALVALPLSFSLLMPFFSSIEKLPQRMSFLAGPITNFSLWSYSIYLSHSPILYTIYAIVGEARRNPFVNTTTKFAGFIACIMFSRFVYTHFESKLTSLRPRE